MHTCSVCRNIMDQPVIAFCCLGIVGCKVCVQNQLQSSNECMKCQRPCSSQSIFEASDLQDRLRLIRQEIQEKF
ncbi:hypothetical protein ANANG_G00169200 [Anguilla anguilla]|uniref:RING-type domain-containing protein n=1 Tax=Anguilla anguilla TaxID=7936 RepID=A0A9D3RTW0_ANGAN|nr:hypothetical protein ANANG_G00169200 [Anguilla anguilla]